MPLRHALISMAFLVGCTSVAAAQTGGSTTTCPETVTIASGDTLGAIAARCGTTVTAIREANPEIGDPRRLRIGTEVRIPEPTAAPGGSAAAAGESGTVGEATGYVIQQGDTWDSIAQETGVDVERLMEANPEIASVALNSGTRIAVPSRNQPKGPPPDLQSSSDGASGTGGGGDAGPGEVAMGLRVVGRLTEEGVECPALRSLDGTLYTLSGNLAEFKPGDDVVVTGRQAEMSTCMQGTTIVVEKIAPAS